MRHLFRSRKILIAVSLILLLFLIAAIVLYLAYGASLKQSLYQGTSISFLQPLTPDKSTTSFEQFSHRIDEIFWVRIVLGFPLTLLFAILVVLVLKRLFRLIEPETLPPQGSASTASVVPLGAAFLVYSICTVLFFYPSFASLGSTLIGIPEDNMQTLWVLWYGNEVFAHHSGSILATDMIYYPEGTSLLYHAFTFYNLFLSFLLRQFMSVIATYNVLMLSTFVLSGLGAFMLIRYLTRSNWLSLVGGFIFAFNPWHFVRSLHHLNLAAMQFIPFFVLYFIKSVREGRKRDLILALLFFLLNALCSWNYMIFCLYFMALGYIYLAIRRHRIWLKDVATRIIVVAAGGFLALSPWLVPMMLTGLKTSGMAGEGHAWLVGDLAGFLIPYRYHLLSQVGIIDMINSTYTGNVWESTVYLGLVALLLIAFTYRKLRSVAAKYIIGGLSFMILTMGAHIHLLGKTIPVSLPYRFIAAIPFLSAIRAPGRNVVFVYLFLAILVTLALGQLLRSVSSRRKGIILVSVISLLLFADYFTVCRNYYKPQLPACYQSLERTGERYGILDLPSGYGEVDRYMLYQTYHHIPIVQGWTSRRIGSTLIDRLELNDLARQKAQLTSARVKYVVIHKNLVTPGRPPHPEEYRNRYRRYYEDSTTVVWQVY